jgi:beta-glucosidase-like glycosyl hydrolase
MPAILARSGDHAMRASPSGNKRGQSGGDAEGDSKAASEQEKIARERKRHQVTLLSNDARLPNSRRSTHPIRNLTQLSSSLTTWKTPCKNRPSLPQGRDAGVGCAVRQAGMRATHLTAQHPPCYL